MKQDRLPRRSKMFARLHRRHTFLRWGISTAVAMLLVVFILFVWFSWARMGNDSMAPTLHKGDLVLVDRLSKYYRNLQRTDLVAYVPKDGQGLIIKRVVALGGERVAGKDGVIYIDDTYTLVERDYGPTNTLDFSPVKVPQGCVFVLSDDRLYFEDSREPAIGCIPVEDIYGVIYIRLFPKITLFK